MEGNIMRQLTEIRHENMNLVVVAQDKLEQQSSANTVMSSSDMNVPSCYSVTQHIKLITD